MSRVEINANGRHIIVEHDTELAYLAKTADELWRGTASPSEKLGSPVGFSVYRSDPGTHHAYGGHDG